MTELSVLPEDLDAEEDEAIRSVRLRNLRKALGEMENILKAFEQLKRENAKLRIKAGVPKQHKNKGSETKNRVTPKEITANVVMAAIAKLGSATAGEVASEIEKAESQTGLKGHVSGRAIRFIAERAGAKVVIDDQGKRRYTIH